MSTTENKQLIQDAFTAWANGDGLVFFNLLADNATWTVMGNCPISGTYVGRQRLVEDVLPASTYDPHIFLRFASLHPGYESGRRL